jgi:hypothetical protein
MIRSFLFLAFSMAALFGQGANTTGVVEKVNGDDKQIVLKTESGEVTVTLAPNGNVRKVPPGETNLQKATVVPMTEVSVGDRALVVGKPAEGQTTMTARLVVIMSQGDIAKKQASEKADWAKRGVIGVVTAASPDEIAISVRGGAGPAKTLIIAPGANCTVLRYAPDSVKFEEARQSTLAEIHTGDQVRALGDKNTDGTKLTAEEIVSGSFRTIAATVISVDAAKHEMRVRDLATKGPVVVRINTESSLKKLPAQMATMLAARNRGEAPAGGRAGGGAPPDGRGGGEGRGMRPAGDLTQMLDRLPAVELADLKAGDAIILLSTVGASPDQLNAITLLAGVEPILTKPGTREMALGEWSLGGGMGGEAGNQ